GGPQDGFEIRSQFGASRREKVTAGLAQIDDRRPGVAFFESGFIVSYGRLDAFADESRELFRRPAGRRTAGQGIVDRRARPSLRRSRRSRPACARTGPPLAAMSAAPPPGPGILQCAGIA